jgi:imidazolonepropionase-like amidohydrolase
MKTANGTTVIRNGQIVDGTGSSALPDGVVIITDGIISYVGARDAAPETPPDANVIDANSGTIMPGLVEAHFHATYFNIKALEDLDIKYPVEYVSLLSSVNSRLVLECGYTAARSGGCLFNVDFWLKNAIESDLIPGPRLSTSVQQAD